MFDRDKLAQELAGHTIERTLTSHLLGVRVVCACGAKTPAGSHVQKGHAAHLADVAATWAEGHMREEWGVQYEWVGDQGSLDSETEPCRTEAVARHRASWASGETICPDQRVALVRRLVTDWAEDKESR
jgi:hypothetical protein